MDISNWLKQSRDEIKENGIHGLRWAALRPYYLTLRQTDRFFDEGEYIFDHEWDVLLILDTCRHDEFIAALQRGNHASSSESMRSRNSVTRLWMDENFAGHDVEKEETIYVVGNPWAEDMVSDEEWGAVDHVYRHEWVEPGTVPPEAMTDAAIHHWRKQSPKRMIVHYMQPHAPYLTSPETAPQKHMEHFGNQPQGGLWEHVEQGKVDLEDAKSAYRSDLDLVLDEIFNRLLTNLDADTVMISADHGEAFGEFSVYGHKPNFPIPQLRLVPWFETSGTDTGSVTPDINREQADETGIEDKLSALGYM